MNFPSFEGIANCAVFFVSFVKNVFLQFLIASYCSIVYTVYKEGIFTGIFISGLRSARTYQTLPIPTRIFSSCLLSLFPLCRPNKKENSFHSNELGEGE